MAKLSGKAAELIAAELKRRADSGDLLALTGAAALGAQSEDAEAGVKSQLAMDLASRMKRAREMGFDMPFYHGTAKDIQQGKEGGIFWGSMTPDLANEYADAAGISAQGSDILQELGYAPNVIKGVTRYEHPVRFRHAEQEKPIREFLSDALNQSYEIRDKGGAKRLFDSLSAKYGDESRPIFQYWNNDPEVADYFRALGFDAIDVSEKGSKSSPTIGVLYPQNVRSVNAAFDPAKADSSDLLAGIGGLAPIAGGAALMAPTEQAQAGMVTPYSPTQIGTALLQRGGPMMQQEAIPARFPGLHGLANIIEDWRDPTGVLVDFKGTADYLRKFGEGEPSVMRAIGAVPF